MKPVYKGILLGVVQIGLVTSLAGKFLHDRATRPRVWVRTAPLDPNLPIRGRYVQLRLEVPAHGFPPLDQPSARGRWRDYRWARLELEGDHLVAVPEKEEKGVAVWLRERDAEPVADVVEPVAFFIPEHISDPSRRPPGEQLWVEVTLPKKGPPRPIRLGVNKEGVLTPLDIR